MNLLDFRFSSLKSFADEYLFYADTPPEAEKEFQSYLRRTTIQRAYIILGFLAGVVALFWPTDFILFSDSRFLITYLIWRGLLIGGISFLLVGLYLSKTLRKNFNLVFVLTVCLMSFGVSYAFARIADLTDPWFWTILIIPWITIFLGLKPIQRFLATLAIVVSYASGFLVLFPKNLRYPHLPTTVILLSGLIILITLSGHVLYHYFRKNFFNERELEKAHQESEELVLNILPEKISERLKAGEDVSEKFDQVTVLFADIVEFTPIANELPADEVVSILDDLFSSFDDLVNEYGLEKIKTIGDEYFVAAGVPEPMENHASKMAQLALRMQEEVKKHERHDGSPFRLRCGMNTGPLVAGIIGKEKFVYDVWGDTVNIGSRMESQGEPGKIQVTPATKRAIEEQDDKGRFEFEERGAIEVKGKGEMTTYFLLNP